MCIRDRRQDVLGLWNASMAGQLMVTTPGGELRIGVQFQYLCQWSHRPHVTWEGSTLFKRRRRRAGHRESQGSKYGPYRLTFQHPEWRTSLSGISTVAVRIISMSVCLKDTHLMRQELFSKSCYETFHCDMIPNIRARGGVAISLICLLYTSRCV